MQHMCMTENILKNWRQSALETETKIHFDYFKECLMWKYYGLCLAIATHKGGGMTSHDKIRLTTIFKQTQNKQCYSNLRSSISNISDMGHFTLPHHCELWCSRVTKLNKAAMQIKKEKLETTTHWRLLRSHVTKYQLSSLHRNGACPVQLATIIISTIYRCRYLN